MPLTPEAEFLAKEREREKNNQIKNKPIIILTYSMVAIFMCLIGYVIYFMQFKSEHTIANSRNHRQNAFADTVERGDIITSDGEIIATNNTDESGNTYRYYPYSNMFAHVVGYNEYGKSGLELQGNFYMLRSHVNIFERLYNEIKEAKNRGDNLVSTLNYELQNVAYNALGDCKGAVVVMEPDTGRILAMVSKPDFDPNNIDGVWDYMQTEEGSESTLLLNRATQGLYAPGSTFKVITLLEYLKEHPNDANNYSYECTGNTIFAGVDLHCNDDTIHGTESLSDSLAYSCNLSFANIGMSLDYNEYKNTAEDLLFNMDLPYDGEYAKSKFYINSKSNASEIPQTAIGQGETKITPLHNAMIMSAIANGGVLMKPHLIQRIESDDGATVKQIKARTHGTLMTNEEAGKLIEYMKTVCDYGTASGYFAYSSYDVAGKTGTAEYDDEGNCNSWFVGFSNPDNPDIVVSVIVEDYNTYGVSGTSIAAQIFDAYYN